MSGVVPPNSDTATLYATAIAPKREAVGKSAGRADAEIAT